MRIAIFGGSGATGQRLCRATLAAGHTVTVLLRNPTSFPLLKEVAVVEGDARAMEPVRKTVLGAEAVLSALGARTLGPDDVLERASPLIVQAMKDGRVRRILVLGAAGAKEDAFARQNLLFTWIARKLVIGHLLKNPMASQSAQWNVLSQSGLDFTVVMPPKLSNAPGRREYRVDGDALPQGGWHISRDDVADFMVKQISSRDWVGKHVYISW